MIASQRRRTPAWKRFLSPVRYLAIHHAMKARFDWWWPIGFTVITMLIFWILPVKPEVLGDKGFLKGIRDLIALLAAFFVVALAAVSTFALDSLDQPMIGTTPTLDGHDLSRRQYVCYLFGYLSVLSFVLFLVAIGAEILAPSLRVALPVIVLWWTRAVLGTLYTLAFWNMFFTTLLGIFFLVERVHLRPSQSGGPTEPPVENRPRSIDREAA